MPTAGKPEQRLKEVKSLAGLLTPGRLQSCVEQWLTEKDGGLQNQNQTRYFVDPGVKVTVSYDDATPAPRVKGRVRAYMESRILD
jgi:hypothetical protein